MSDNGRDIELLALEAGRELFNLILQNNLFIAYFREIYIPVKKEHYYQRLLRSSEPNEIIICKERLAAWDEIEENFFKLVSDASAEGLIHPEIAKEMKNGA